MAGHPKAPEHRRTERFNLRFTLDEMVHIQEQAEAAGIDATKYLRRRALGYVVPPANRVDPALVSELNRIGVNVNQIARNLNTGRQERLEVNLVLAELRDVLARVLESAERQP